MIIVTLSVCAFTDSYQYISNDEQCLRLLPKQTVDQKRMRDLLLTGFGVDGAAVA